MKLITNKRIIAFMIRTVLKTGEYWQPIRYGKKTYLISFQYNVFECPNLMVKE